MKFFKICVIKGRNYEGSGSKNLLERISSPMKKRRTRTRKLELDKKTLRRISDELLGKVAGATPTVAEEDCVSQPPLCS